MKSIKKKVCLFFISFVMLFSMIGTTNVFALDEFPYLKTIDKNLISSTKQNTEDVILTETQFTKNSNVIEEKDNAKNEVVGNNAKYVTIQAISIVAIAAVLYLLAYLVKREQRRAATKLKNKTYSINTHDVKKHNNRNNLKNTIKTKSYNQQIKNKRQKK